MNRFVRNRYAQELANEGWRGFRSRLVNLHLRFYGAVLVVIVLAFGFPYMPVYAIIMMYSFWWPQIFYSVYAGKTFY